MSKFMSEFSLSIGKSMKRISGLGLHNAISSPAAAAVQICDFTIVPLNHGVVPSFSFKMIPHSFSFFIVSGSILQVAELVFVSSNSVIESPDLVRFSIFLVAQMLNFFHGVMRRSNHLDVLTFREKMSVELSMRISHIFFTVVPEVSLVKINIILL